MHITSLPSPYGIGSMGKAAYDFIDFLRAAKQTYWQILPINPPGYGDSPYQAFSTFAGALWKRLQARCSTRRRWSYIFEKST